MHIFNIDMKNIYNNFHYVLTVKILIDFNNIVTTQVK